MRRSSKEKSVGFGLIVLFNGGKILTCRGLFADEHAIGLQRRPARVCANVRDGGAIC